MSCYCEPPGSLSGGYKDAQYKAQKLIQECQSGSEQPYIRSDIQNTKVSGSVQMKGTATLTCLQFIASQTREYAKTVWSAELSKTANCQEH